MSKIDLTAQSGDWRWAGAMGYLGHKVQLPSWNRECYYCLQESVGWVDECRNPVTGPRYYDDWRLYEEPAPAPKPVPSPPKPVRWKMEMGLNGLVVMIPHEDRCSITYLQAGKPVALHRLLNFICIPPEDPSEEWKTASAPFVFYDPQDVSLGWATYQDNEFTRQLWATYADVLRVGGK